MAGGALIAGSAGLQIAGGLMSGYGAQKGARAAQKSISGAITDVNTQSAAMGTEQRDLQQPWMTAGAGGLKDLQAFQMRQPDAYNAGTFGGVDMSKDPGVQYRMDQSQKAFEGGMAKKGMALGGMAAKGLAEQQQNLASQEYQNAYTRDYGAFKDAEDARRNQSNTEADRNMNLDQFTMNKYKGIADMGQGATNQLGSALQGIGTNKMNATTQLQGQLADAKAKQAAGMWGSMGTALSSGGSAMGNYGAYKMGKE